tara:strand:+ start:1494 stop:3038 length:1545 start_codon:yes stop_codon:yes gene_type:complete
MVIKDDALATLHNLKEQFQNTQISIRSIDLVCEYIAICAEMGRKESPLVENFTTAEEMFEECIQKFPENEKLLLHGVDLYKYLLKLDKRVKILEALIKKGSTNKIIWTAYIISNMYMNKWKQEDYKNFSLKFKNLFPFYKTKDINTINFKKKKIRVGFISPDFHSSHSITYFLTKLISDFRESKFETIALSLVSKIRHDNTTKFLKGLFSQWVDLDQISNQDIVSKIQNHDIDILIDLSGLTAGNKIEIFNTRICPIQISWLGFNNTIGLKCLDYLIGDKILVSDDEKNYNEKIIKLPKIWNAHCGFDFERKFNDLPKEKNGFLTFGSFNNFMKVNDEQISSWIEILKSVPNSKIILKSSLYVCENTIRKKFEENDLIESLEIRKKTKKSGFFEHIQMYKEIDIALDTFPWTGVTTTFEALWMNVPVLTRKGFNFNSRCGESILKNANLIDFIAEDKADYVNKAIYYSKNIEELKDKRFYLYENILNTPLFDSKNFSSSFIKKLEEISDNIKYN